MSATKGRLADTIRLRRLNARLVLCRSQTHYAIHLSLEYQIFHKRLITILRCAQWSKVATTVHTNPCCSAVWGISLCTVVAINYHCAQVKVD